MTSGISNGINFTETSLVRRLKFIVYLYYFTYVFTVGVIDVVEADKG